MSVMSEIDTLFKQHTKTSFEDGRCSIICFKGLWGVTSPTEEESLREARYYFLRHYMDGEYDE